MAKLDKFTEAYIRCALWASTDDVGNPLDKKYGVANIEPDTLEHMVQDCFDFQSANADLLNGLNDEQCGYDFWLTRNGHGAGFWDRGLGLIGDQLTEAAKESGITELYVGDDGRIYST
jgi:hypothetical protein